MSVYRRKKSWAFAVEVARDENGNRTRHQKAGFATKREAQQAMNEVLHQLGAGNYVEPVKLTVATFLRDQWLPAIKGKIKRSTFESYEDAITNRIAPHIGATKLQALTSQQLNAFYTQLLKSGRSDGKGGLAPKTVRNCHVVIHKALADAVKWNVLPRNVAAFADPPKVRQDGDAEEREEMRTWTASELRTFLESARGERLFPLFHLSSNTGMRRGEVLGLRWVDVDLEAGQLAVRQTLLSLDYELIFSTPKTKRSRRTIALDSNTVAVLRAWKKRQLEERIAIGSAYQETGLVFTKVDGACLHPDLVSQSFDRLVKRAGVTRIPLRDLRHTHASLALLAGVPVKVVSERLGHASVAFTMDVYSHVLPGMQEDAAEKIAALISTQGP